MREQQVKWRLPELWTVVRSDGGSVRIDLTQDGDTISGTAHAADGAGAGDMVGTMSGSTTGDSIEMTIYWPGGAIVEYRGSADRQGQVGGTTFDQSGTTPPADWHAEAPVSLWS